MTEFLFRPFSKRSTARQNPASLRDLSGFTGYDPGLLEDLKIGVEHPTAGSASAVVTDVGWIVQMMRISASHACPVKLFRLRRMRRHMPGSIAAS